MRDSPPSCPGVIEILTPQVIRPLGAMMKHKAPDPDLVPVDLYCEEPYHWASLLTKVFNAAIAGNAVPLSWHSAITVLIFKKGDRGFPANYQAHRLYMISYQFMIIRKSSLYLVFINPKAAFDSVDRGKLWRLLLDLRADAALVKAIAAPHSGSMVRVRYGPGGECTDLFQVEKGVRQGCMLVPSLFSLFRNDVVDSFRMFPS
ncbi:hypothetical protein NDU88_000750 [Pleurodeles waltl]|uniref:Reverse transcriptase domain-containing protein n=1 Tax=Pleurodeles waltl TaxID=8319 RepID=A0AAV7WJG0_PLEWA|nr:hypothetical protein NDU88_000750 [Pleurodeles waltl]